MADVSVRLTRLLADIAGAGRTIPVEAATVAAALDALCRQVPALRVHIFDDAGAVRRHVNIFVRGELTKGLDALSADLADGDEVAIVQAVSGGAGGQTDTPRAQTVAQWRSATVSVATERLVLGGIRPQRRGQHGDGRGAQHQPYHVGVERRDQLARFYGLTQDRPVRYMREYIDVVRMVAEARAATYPGEIFDIRDYHSRTTYTDESPRLPVFLGVLNEQMLRLAGRVADGVILAYFPKPHIARAKAWVAEGAAQAGRDPTDITIAAIAPVAVSSDAGTAEEALRLRIASYINFPDHNRMLRASGHGPALDAMQGSLAQEDWSTVARELPDDLVADIGISGSSATCKASLQSWTDSDVDLLLLIPVAMPNISVAQHHADVVEAF